MLELLYDTKPYGNFSGLYCNGGFSRNENGTTLVLATFVPASCDLRTTAGETVTSLAYGLGSPTARSCTIL